MASFNIHLAVAKKYDDLNNIEDKDAYYRGVIEPDLVKDKKKSHYTVSKNKDDIIEYLSGKVNLYEYLKNNSIDTDYDKGVFIHLITDYLFFNYFFTKSYLYRLDYSLFCKDLYYSYDETNAYLIEKYNIVLPDLLDEMNKSIEKDRKEKCMDDVPHENIIPFDKLDYFIEDCSSIDLYEYKKLIIKEKRNVLPKGLVNAITIIDDIDYLRQVSSDVDLNSDISSDIKILEKYCLRHDVFAMAAIQIGIPKRIMYLKNTSLDKVDEKNWNERQIFINPIIKKREGLTHYWEACASCLDNCGDVYRPYKIEIEYIDELGNKKEKIFEGFEATVFSHEYDHFDGILHIDIAKELKKMRKEERKEWRKTHPYEIISYDGEYETLLSEQD